jgi:hypothetical protein
MSTLTTINGDDLIKDSRADINNNFDALNDEKIETSYLDTDTTLAANSDTKIATQKAVKAYVDSGGNQNASETNKGIVEEATDAEVTAGTATGATGAKLFVTPAKLATRLGAGFTDVQTFTATGTWTKPSFGTWALVEMWGGGGSGGAYRSNTADTVSGGGGGEQSSVLIPLEALGETETVTVGAGGTAASSNGSAAQGVAGGDTSFGTAGAYGVAKGGSGGAATETGTSAGGAGGTGGTNDFYMAVKKTNGAAGGEALAAAPASVGVSATFSGSGGGSTSKHDSTGSAGGSSTYFTSVGGAGSYGSGAGNAGTGYASGGGGRLWLDTTATPTLSGAGAPGYVRITVF